MKRGEAGRKGKGLRIEIERLREAEMGGISGFEAWRRGERFKGRETH